MAKAPVLKIDDLHVYYGESHAIQGVSLELNSGVLSVVGRNGMGKSTLCNTITGLKRATSGSIRFMGRELSQLQPHEIYRLGVGYVPQGRRMWQSLSVDETLKLVAKKDTAWTIDRVYQVFPRLAERRNNGGTQLSGGEQQMLAIGRALLSNPKLLIMDEPTEGLAPVIVDHVAEMLITLGAEGEMAILVIEQNIGVATSVSNNVAIMVNGQINRLMDAKALANDRDLQQKLLGVGRHSDEEVSPQMAAETSAHLQEVYRIEREQVEDYTPPNRWNLAASSLQTAKPLVEKKIFAIPFHERIGKTVLVVGTFDTKGKELRFIADCLKAHNIPVKTVDLSTSGKSYAVDVPASLIASHQSKTMNNERGASISAMAEGFTNWIAQERGVGGIISAGGSGGTTLATAGMRALPFGIPKIMVSTVASGDIAAYIGASDIMMHHSVTDIQGLNSITKQVLTNAANAMAGMVAQLDLTVKPSRPAVALTMFGVTTPLIQEVAKRLENDYDCLIFHATGTGGRAMESLGLSNKFTAFLDLTTTEVADMLVGGVFAADKDRFGAAISTGLPYIGSVGACDMVNFGARHTIPEKYKNRKFVEHNANVTLMRTTRDENRAIGEWIGSRLNLMNGQVRFLLPEGGVSSLDAKGQAFYDMDADNALFEALERTVKQTAQCKIIRVKANINDKLFVETVLDNFKSIVR